MSSSSKSTEVLRLSVHGRGVEEPLRLSVLVAESEGQDTGHFSQGGKKEERQWGRRGGEKKIRGKGSGREESWGK